MLELAFCTAWMQGLHCFYAIEYYFARKLTGSSKFHCCRFERKSQGKTKAKKEMFLFYGKISKRYAYCRMFRAITTPHPFALDHSCNYLFENQQMAHEVNNLAVKQFPYCFASFCLVIWKRTETIPRVGIRARTHEFRPMTILCERATEIPMIRIQRQPQL